MAEKSIVTFYDPNRDLTIEVTFQYNPETQSLDYNTDIRPEFDPKKDQDGLTFFLANQFMESLLAQDEKITNDGNTDTKD